MDHSQGVTRKKKVSAATPRIDEKEVQEEGNELARTMARPGAGLGSAPLLTGKAFASRAMNGRDYKEEVYQSARFRFSALGQDASSMT